MNPHTPQINKTATTKRIKAALLAVVAACTLGFAACGGSDEPAAAADATSVPQSADTTSTDEAANEPSTEASNSEASLVAIEDQDSLYEEHLFAKEGVDYASTYENGQYGFSHGVPQGFVETSTTAEGATWYNAATDVTFSVSAADSVEKPGQRVDAFPLPMFTTDGSRTYASRYATSYSSPVQRDADDDTRGSSSESYDTGSHWVVVEVSGPIDEGFEAFNQVLWSLFVEDPAATV